MLVIPCTSIKEDSPEASFYELDIDVRIRRYYIKSRMQLSDMRCVDIQRLDLRKRFCNVVTSREEIEHFIKENVFGEDENEKSLEWGFWIYKFNNLFVSLAMTSSSFVGIT